jgi:myo-inositol-1(or 4)-monophosphatase
MSRTRDLEKITHALDLARKALAPFTPGDIEARLKEGDDPVTAADLAVNEVLLNYLPGAGEGWLSEETADDPARLQCSRVWVVDPVDGTREFVQGIPEWCVSIAMVEDGVPMTAGICNPSTDEMILGIVGEGVTLNGRPVTPHPATTLAGTRVLGSRSEFKRGEWDRFLHAEFEAVAMGSVAYKLGRIGAGLDAVTWTLVPKNEWDVAAGAALVTAVGGEVLLLDGTKRTFNSPDPLMSGFLGAAPGVIDEVLALLEIERA